MEPIFSWLCPTPRDRERFLDMQERLAIARAVTIAAGAIVAGALAFSTNAGWKVVAAGGIMVAIVVIGGWHLERRRRPELWIFFSAVVNIQVMLAVGALMTGGPRSVLVTLLALPVVMVGARFSNRGLAIGAPVSALLIVGVSLGADPGYVASHPESVALPLAMLLSIAFYLRPMVDSDVRHRADSTLDQLTGLLNRRGLEPRFSEVAEQAALDGHPISVVVADIDHFKRINDAEGHVVGDMVLREVADTMRRNLRTFELLYRIGGEEFLLLLPGAGIEDATKVAEKLRVAVEELRPSGLAVACSFGVATAHHGAAPFETLLRTADAALYEAKRRGRNRVEGGSSTVPVAA